MIAQLLNRQFLLEQMESLTQQLSKDVRQERRGGRETEELYPADYREALDHLTKALEKERALSSGQPGYDVAADRRDGDRSAVLDDFSFFSRDPIVSIVQSALEYSYKQSDSRVQVVHQELSDDRFRGGDDYPAVTNLSLKDFQPRRGANTGACSIAFRRPTLAGPRRHRRFISSIALWSRHNTTTKRRY